MSLLVLVIAGVLAMSGHCNAAYCNGSPDAGERTNPNPIYSGELRKVKQIKNAVLYEAGPKDAPFPVVHLWGNAYDRGFAQGTIMKEYMDEFFVKLWKYLLGSITDGMGNKLPEALQKKIAEEGIERALDWTARTTESFTPKTYFDEMHGLADASGIDYETILRTNLFAELTKASCSFFGAWGAATEQVGGHAYQLRSLDYDTDGPFKNYMLVTVYHPESGDGGAWMQVGWPGSIGALTGFNDRQIMLSEIGITFADDSFGQGTDDTPPEKVHGKPWMFVTRDMLQYSSGLEEAVSSIQKADRTCNLVIGVGDGKLGKSNGIEYSGRVAQPYDDVTLLPVNETWHKKIDNIVYNGMDWLCPSYNQKLGDSLTKYYGSINAETTIKNILPTVQTGNLHILFTDLSDSQAFVSFMRKSTKSGTDDDLYAYQRQFTQLDMKAIFQEPKPQE
jgi:hypothetical protein